MNFLKKIKNWITNEIKEFMEETQKMTTFFMLVGFLIFLPVLVPIFIFRTIVKAAKKR